MKTFENQIDDIIGLLKLQYGQEIPPGIAKIIQEEGNFEEWTTFHYLCRIKRSKTIGAWLGYVRVPDGHPAFGKHYDDIDIDVHGGLTYSDYHFPDDGYCQIGNYWLGFDCAHGCDYSPGMDGPEYAFQYKNKKYAKTECMKLAGKLKEMMEEKENV